VAAKSTNNVKICGPQLAVHREGLGYSQRELADLLGLTEKRIQQIEGQEEVGVYRRTIRKMAELMHVPVGTAINLLNRMDFSVIGEPGETGPVRGYEDLWAELDRLLERLAEIEGTDVQGIIEMLVKGTAPGRDVRSPKSRSTAHGASPQPTPAKQQPPVREAKGEKVRRGRSK
jgi:transcriptional regulator with XRE-family HTH domain